MQMGVSRSHARCAGACAHPTSSIVLIAIIARHIMETTQEPPELVNICEMDRPHP